ncbi:FBD-like protein [Artemisia annua]|uniref:FBD-like protein n=1 Tax=Artemisia annua TaxID=35608 RepID=A0A2U1MWS8_ARTAN|nr:FBD-like protein [Artemisia annua]
MSIVMESQDVDRLSNMPDEVLSEVLSLMPTKFAARTSILSKKWRYKWTLVTNIDIDVHPFHGLQNCCNFVDRVLDLCQTTEIKLFRLRFSNLWVQKSSMTKWINDAISLNVRDLDIQFALLELPVSFFTCKTLTKLRIENGSDFEVMDWQTPFNLPCLKTLDIAIFSDPSLNAFRLIRGCPVLESLSLKITWRGDEEDYIFRIPTLKHLKLSVPKCASIINKVVLNVPNLDSFCLDGTWCSLFVMEDFPSLVSVSFSFSEVRFVHLYVELLKGITGAKSLSLDRASVRLPDASFLKFPNLKHLEFKSGYRLNWLFIFQFLESCSELEQLFIQKPDMEQPCWTEPHSLPTCILNNLTTIKYENCMGREDELQFLEYMLGNAQVLKTLAITFNSGLVEEETRLYAKFLKCPRASRYCEIRFLGKSFGSASR